MIENIPQQSGAIGSMDIPSPGFFWMLRPWKQGKLATMDGKARFAEVSFVGKSRIRISPLVNYPRARIDRLLLVAPESNMFITGSGAEFHVADVAGKKTKSLVPFTGWHFEEAAPLILDLENGIINFRYLATRSYQRESNYQPYYNVIYDAKNDRVLYESPRNVGESHYLFYPVTPEWGMGQKRNYNGILETLLYNWKTHETAGNELTKKLTVLGSSSRLELGCNINFEERYLFTDIERLGEQKKVKITWDENYEDVTVTPLDYLIPDGKWLYDFYLSTDGKWATNFFGGYRGLYRELLDKRVFFHLDARYPNGISMPIFVDEYYKDPWNYGAFVEHPEYGLCYTEEKWRNDDDKEKLYLRLYKMDDVLDEINRQL